MHFRPDFALRQLHMDQQRSAVHSLRSDGHCCGCDGCVHCPSTAAMCLSISETRLLRYTGCAAAQCVAVQWRIVVKRNVILDPTAIPAVTATADLTGLSWVLKHFVSDSFLCAVADAHPWLNGCTFLLVLHPAVDVDRFKQLEELVSVGVRPSRCRFLCSHATSTIRGWCYKLTSAGLHATNLGAHVMTAKQ